MSAEKTQDNKEEVYDPEVAKDQKLRSAALRRANLNAVFGRGMGRVALFTFGGCLSLLFIFGIYKLAGGKVAAPVRPAVNANDAVVNGSPVTADTTVGSVAEANLRKDLYHQQARDAAQTGQPYMAPSIVKEDKPAPETAPVAKPATDITPKTGTVDLTAAQGRQNPGVNNQVLDKDMKDLRDLVTKMKENEVMPQVLVALGKDSGQGVQGGSGRRQAFSTGVYSVQQQTVAAAAPAGQGASAMPQTVAATSTTKCTVPLIQAGDSCYGQIKFGINTDFPGKNAFVTVFQCKGIEKATAIGKYEETDQDVGVTLDKLAIPGRTALAIQAEARPDGDAATPLADDVDNHYVQRFVTTGIAALASGIGKAAAMPQGTIQTTGYPGTTSTVSTQEAISGARQVKIAVGEMGTAAGSELKKQNDKLKPTKKVFPQKDVKVVFLNDVCDEKK